MKEKAKSPFPVASPLLGCFCRYIAVPLHGDVRQIQQGLVRKVGGVSGVIVPLGIDQNSVLSLRGCDQNAPYYVLIPAHEVTVPDEKQGILQQMLGKVVKLLLGQLLHLGHPEGGR